ncbi:zinc-dependent metalloprotease family protein [Rhizobium sp. TRM95796]|uniref:zinc-dependent metalloprotease family protein n=1 Tax=Rhizobium sp. TRM95796 TaxID=2979862 RepID=UPI0021E82408|nr:M10 family metallopeptidase C-terminal domain-containing protein [Rhizobium sp. TRM95796]MCV3766682.1 M10 family metallopeptidase C-terminal domain-containing protein [Rhizobium sp. TRM95796]
MARVQKRTIDDDDNVFLEGILWKKVDSDTIAAWNDQALWIHFKDTAANSWTWADKSFFKSVFDQWTDVTRLSYRLTNDATKADMVETIVPQKFFGGGGGGNVTLGAHETPYFEMKNGVSRGWYWDDMLENGSTREGSLIYSTVLHELGHALGLAHPHDKGGGSSIFPNTRYDHSAYTIMSYNEAYSFGANGKITLRAGALGGLDQDYGLRIDPAAFDIEAIQAIYGVKQAARGDNVYRLSDENGYWTTPWDTGGIDTLRYDGDGRATLDLRPASLKQGASDAGGGLSYVAGVYGGVTMASDRTVKTAVIERAVGGDGDDRIIGNDANNRISGRGGDDVIDGGGGAVDLVNYRGAYDNYWVRIFASGTLVEQEKNTSKFDDGFDRLKNVEYLHFSNGYVSLVEGRQSSNARATGLTFAVDGVDPGKMFSMLVGFTSGEDTIVLKDDLFDGLAKGRLDADQFVLGDKALDADDHLIFDYDARALYYDADGAGGAEKVLVAAFGDLVDVAARDFLVV